MSEAAFPVEPARRRHPRLGYLMAAVAAILWGVNGGVSKTILATGLSSERLAQVRSYILTFGVGGFASVQFFYSSRSTGWRSGSRSSSSTWLRSSSHSGHASSSTPPCAGGSGSRWHSRSPASG